MEKTGKRIIFYNQKISLPSFTLSSPVEFQEVYYLPEGDLRHDEICGVAVDNSEGIDRALISVRVTHAADVAFVVSHCNFILRASNGLTHATHVIP